MLFIYLFQVSFYSTRHEAARRQDTAELQVKRGAEVTFFDNGGDSPFRDYNEEFHHSLSVKFIAILVLESGLKTL